MAQFFLTHPWIASGLYLCTLTAITFWVSDIARAIRSR